MNYEYLVVILKWLPDIFFGVVFLGAGFLYFKRENFSVGLWFKKLIIVVIGFRILYAALLTISQYYVWTQNQFTKILVDTPGYFSFYSYGRFWLSAIVSIAAGFLFYLVLLSLKKHNERFFDIGEVELGFLGALIVGWPDFVIFVPLIFISVVLISIFRGVFLKETYTTLGWPILAAVLVALIWGSELIVSAGLEVLRI